LVALESGVTDLGRAGETILDGWRWQALVLDAAEASLVAAGSVCLPTSPTPWPQ
jgi:hypothetical protein